MTHLVVLIGTIVVDGSRCVSGRSDLFVLGFDVVVLLT